MRGKKSTAIMVSVVTYGTMVFIMAISLNG